MLTAKINAVKRKRVIREDSDETTRETTVPVVVSTPAPRPKRKRAPVRKVPVQVKRHHIWSKLESINAGLSISDWLALDKRATQDLMAGIRTLRSRKKTVSASPGNQDEMIIDSLPMAATGLTGDTPMAPTLRVAALDNDGDSDSSSSWESEVSSTPTETTLETTVSDESASEQLSIINYPYSLPSMKASAPLKVPVSVHGHVIYAILDSGASVSVMNQGLANSLGLKPNGDHMNLVAFDDYQLSPASVVPNVPIMIGGHLRPEHVCIQQGHSQETDYLILGTTFCKNYKVQINMANSMVSFPVSYRGQLSDLGEVVEVQGFSQRIGNHMTDQDRTARTVSWVDELDAPSEILAVSVAMHPNEVKMVDASRAGSEMLTTYFEDVVEADSLESEQQPVKEAPAIGMPGPSYESQVPDFQVNHSQSVKEALANITTKGITEDPPAKNDNPLDISAVPAFLQDLLVKYADCFVEVSGLGRVKGFKHDIKIKPGAQPVRAKPYKLTWEENAALEKQLKEMLEMDLIEPGTGEWSSPCFFLRKRSGELRLVIDYRKLNSVTLRDLEIPLPSLEELVDLLAGKANYITTLDMAQGYYQVEHTEDAKRYSQFVTPTKGCFSMKVLAFGEAGGPFTFGNLMQNIFKDYIGDFIFIFYDDAIIFSKTQEDHVKHLELVFKQCKEFNLRLKWKKCKFGDSNAVEYLGHLITPSGLLPLDRNTDKIKNFPTLKNQDDLRSFLGLTNYYHKFIPGYSLIAEPLYKLLKKKEPFHWGEEQEKAFEMLKKALTSPPLLSYPKKEFVQVLTTDASYLGISGILSQVNPQDPAQEEVLSYQSRALRTSERNYSQVHLEALAVVFFVQKFAHYLSGRKFILRVDNQAISFLLNPAKSGKFSAKLSRWSACLSGFEFETVSLVKSKDNPADPLSRIF